jgi:hypothetical protein
MSPILTSGLPLVRSISAVSLTNSMGSKVFSLNFKAKILQNERFWRTDQPNRSTASIAATALNHNASGTFITVISKH